MTELSGAKSGKFNIGGDMPVHRLGFGAMRITGAGIWGAPNNPEEARRTLRRIPELGIDFIDTADAYGPFISEQLIRETLHPYKNIVIATKGGLTRQGPNSWLPLGRPEYLRQCVQLSLRHLGVERIDLWQLHRIDAKVPRAEQFGVMAEMQQQGLIRHLGLSEVSVEEIQAASHAFKVATVQNRYNLVDRGSEDVLNHCEQHGIGFIPWYPLASGALTQGKTILTSVAARLGATPGQVALAWVLQRSPCMLPIPGTSSVAHLEENAGAASVELTDADFTALDSQGRAQSERAA
jgi:aryl-alcohol dehydrogenase-like predicted oxidoreductase